MFVILADKTICITRGDIANFDVFAKLKDGKLYKFHAGDVVRFQVFKKKDCSAVVIKKDFAVEAEAESVNIYLGTEDTRFGEVIHKPVDYWYEVIVNPDTAPQTIIGYDEEGEKIYRIYPEGVAE
jgi:hypothetical protein